MSLSRQRSVSGLARLASEKAVLRRELQRLKSMMSACPLRFARASAFGLALHEARMQTRDELIEQLEHGPAKAE